MFGILGLLVRNTYLDEINGSLIISGIASILEYSLNIPKLHFLPLSLCTGLLLLKYNKEFLKLLKCNNIGTIMITLFELLFVYSTIYYVDTNIVFIVILLMMLQLSMMISMYLFFWNSTIKLIIFKTFIASLIGCGAIIIENICIREQWLWAKIIFGMPIANICNAYALYTTGQLLLLLRGKNLLRKVNIKGNSIIFIVYYTGRL